jgi:hypothetical protein
VCVVTDVHHVLYASWYWCTPRSLYHMILVYTTFSIPHDTGVHHVLYTTWWYRERGVHQYHVVERTWCTPVSCDIENVVYTSIMWYRHVLYTTWCVCRYWCTPRSLYHMILVYTTFSIPHDTGVHHIENVVYTSNDTHIMWYRERGVHQYHVVYRTGCTPVTTHISCGVENVVYTSIMWCRERGVHQYHAV